MPGSTTIEELMRQVSELNYLPKIAGMNERWEVVVNRRAICSFGKEPLDSMYIADPTTQLVSFAADGMLRVFLRYRAARD